MPSLHRTRPRLSFVYRLSKIVRSQGLIDHGDRIIVAISGGPDSVALLSALHELAPTFALFLSAVHFNYGLRGQESEEDEAFVVHLCRRLHIPYVCEPLRLTEVECKGRSLQEAARDARYEALLRIRASIGAHKVALGHTRDDQAETILMGLLRGAGATGLSGMAPARLPFIRPFLTIRRHDILAYLREQHLTFREDSTNAKPIYTRNRVRHEVLPLLRQFNPALVDVLARQADLLREDDRYLDEVADRHFVQIAQDAITGTCILKRPELLALPVALQRRVLRKAVQHSSGQLRGPSSSAVGLIIDQILRGRSGVRMTIGRVQVAREFNSIRFQRLNDQQEMPTKPESRVLPVPSTVAWPATGQLVHAEYLELPCSEINVASLSPTQVMVDRDRFTADLHVRAWLPGDRFCPYGLEGRRKKLQDFFSDAKVPQSVRPRIPLIVAPEGIVWVAGYRIDHRFRVTATTTHLVRLTLISKAGPER